MTADSAHHRTAEELEASLSNIRQAPADNGTLELIVRRPAVDEREVLDFGTLSLEEGLVGDTWNQRGSSKSPDGGPLLDAQLNIMNARAAAAVAGPINRWALAGDQLYIDLDISTETLPPGTRLALGEAVIEVTAEPHTGCGKFSSRFGLDALRFVNSPTGRALNLRGINARVIHPGPIHTGDQVTRLP
ncbi:MAG: MOSC domain-containing protein [bacterium]|nr:MOSC domain-containing protein [bacterium]MYB10306.1 MOSC domain-containing protein [Acidimicrobiia bacterium]MYG57038.1 MOSC domain-containing protein [Acidimicrobiia bacterium]MYJ33345.1 MOSC domain-containing protein [Acidimicrobiia bacterium]